MIHFEDLTHLFNVDWQSIEDHVNNTLVHLPRGGTAFGGWSAQSASGSYLDAWLDGSVFYKKVDGKPVWDAEAAKAAGWQPKEKHTKLTDACNPALESVIEQMTDLGFYPVRARLSCLNPGRKSTWHTDGNSLTMRMHFVIETNDKAWFRHPDGYQHLPARHVYLINVNDYHQVGNDGTTNRTHLIVDVIDADGISKVHKPNKI